MLGKYITTQAQDSPSRLGFTRSFSDILPEETFCRLCACVISNWCFSLFREFWTCFADESWVGCLAGKIWHLWVRNGTMTYYMMYNFFIFLTYSWSVKREENIHPVRYCNLLSLSASLSKYRLGQSGIRFRWESPYYLSFILFGLLSLLACLSVWWTMRIF